MVLHLLFLLLWLATVVEASASRNVSVKPGCQSKCGNMDIPYPFGIGDGCFFDGGGFEITCNATFAPPKPFKGGLEVLNISVLTAEMSIALHLSWECYSRTGQRTNNSFRRVHLRNDSLFTFSDTRNKFIAIGCDTIGRFKVHGDEIFSECGSLCSGTANVIDGSCSGFGCCQLTIPKGLKHYRVDLNSYHNHTSIWDFSWCSFAFLADQDVFSFNASDLQGIELLQRTPSVPVVLDWAIGSENCNSSLKNSATHACTSENSQCYNSANGLGYGCNCSLGFEGNPYLPGGCQGSLSKAPATFDAKCVTSNGIYRKRGSNATDIDECSNNNGGCQQACTNSQGSYFCSCRNGYHLDEDRKTCIENPPNKKEVPILTVTLAFGLSLLFLLISTSWAYWAWNKRKLIKLKEEFFKRNGGLLLQEKISSHQTYAEAFKIFNTEELKKATDNYNDSRVIGQGGFGTVYKGILPDQRIVAIKKSKIVDKTQIEQFINEVLILSQINHRNVVKLLGCCLEDEVPSLVYEFISNGTLSDHIHGQGQASPISLENRLRIAAETAEALYYLHSAAAIPIIHRDVKSTNILLDNNFTAKVSDFGASRLVPLDQTQINTLVQGTWGYVDPESFQTGQLTEKSDVYSFGVVLVELLTGEMAVSSTRSHDMKSLSTYFLSSVTENRLFEILEDRVRDEGEAEQLIAIAQVAKRCLNFRGEERPSMKEVMVEIKGLRTIHEHPWEPRQPEETENLLGESSQGYIGNTTVEHSMQGHIMSSLEMGR